MSGDGWKTVYMDIAKEQVASLNTPKRRNIDILFLKLIGFQEASGAWTLGEAAVDEFVSARGDIAHRGRDAGYVTINRLRDVYRPQIAKTAVETDNAVATYLHRTFEPHQYPWRRRNA
jgi:hypothetical protein